jgi:murein DD-endopeptidase MepM/ murein hydrolase activator NlpD
MQNHKTAILAQKALVHVRERRLRTLIALSTLPLFGVVAAFGIAPETDTRNVPVHTVIENLGLPANAPTVETHGDYWREERVQRGDTIASLLARLNVSDEETAEFLRSAKDSRMLRQLVPGRIVRAKTTDNGDLLALRYLGSDETMLSVEKQNNTFTASDQPVALEQRIQMKSGEIKNSLFGATDAANVADNVAMQIVDIFSSEIDFHQDLRRGDHFTVVYEGFYNNGEFIKAGRVLAVEFINQGRSYRAVYFQDRQGRGGYYTPDGKSLRKAFLRSPLEFSRITSGFTSARFHPVLKEWRAHKGVDYGAPIGTRVKATADGVVTFAGRQNGYGNLIVLQHQGQYSTAYGHLSGFAKGLHKGSRVNQGDVIGFVGMTGLATGPHLHYEFRIAGVQRNPLSLNIPTAMPLNALQKAEFTRAANPLLARLELLRGTNLASLE